MTSPLDAKYRGQTLQPEPIPALVEDDPATGLTLLPTLSAHAMRMGCSNPRKAWAHWHKTRWAKRNDRKTWKTDWYADFEAWMHRHEEYGCPCKRRPSPDDDRRDRELRDRERNGRRDTGTRNGPQSLGALLPAFPGKRDGQDDPEARQTARDDAGRASVAEQARLLRQRTGS